MPGLWTERRHPAGVGGEVDGTEARMSRAREGGDMAVVSEQEQPEASMRARRVGGLGQGFRV